MREKGWEVGGENSGHIICLDKHTTSDGIVSALQVLQAMRESGRTLAELTAELVMYPQVLVNVAVPKGFDWKKHAAIKSAQAGRRALVHAPRPRPRAPPRHGAGAARDGGGQTARGDQIGGTVDRPRRQER